MSEAVLHPARCTVLALAALSAAGLAHAQQQKAQARPSIEVLHDSGSSIPLAPYLADLVSIGREQAVMPDLPFPIRSSLRAGVLPADGVQVFDPKWLTQPMFVVAADVTDMQWLAHNQARLASLRATGLVVKADSAAAFKVVQRVAQGLPVAPVTTEWLAHRLKAAGAGVHPLLIQTDGRAFQVLPSQESP